MTSNRRIVLYPGNVFSKTDGQLHYITRKEVQEELLALLIDLERKNDTAA